MKALFRKLKSKAGESLVETLAAILIFTMASVVMYSMVTTAADINSTVKEKDKQNQVQMVAVEKGDPAAKTGEGTVTFYLGSHKHKIAETSVDIFGGENESLYSFFVGD